jgi:hypothetical protein
MAQQLLRFVVQWEEPVALERRDDAVPAPSAVSPIKDHCFVEGVAPILTSRDPQLAYDFLRRHWVGAATDCTHLTIVRCIARGDQHLVFGTITLRLPCVKSIENPVVTSMQDWVLC